MTEPLIPGGYILLSRKIIESKIWDKPPLYIKVWIYLLSSAQHSDYKLLRRSELRTSIPEIQENCSWHVGYRKEVPTKDQIFNILEWLRNPYESNYESNDETTMITTTKATHGMLIKIVNYNVYQDAKNYESNNDDDDETDTKALREQRTADNINKNVKNVKDINMGEIIDINTNAKSKKAEINTDIDNFFETLWREYPKKKGKDKISKTQKKELFKIGVDEMLRAIERYKKETINTDLQYIQYGSTFFNKGYKDYLDVNCKKEDNRRTGVPPCESILGKREELW